MNDVLFDRDALGFGEWAVTPGREAIIPDSIAAKRHREELRRELAKEPDTVIISHIDADGYTSAALLIPDDPATTTVATVGYQDAYGLTDRLYTLLNTPDFSLQTANLRIADLNPDSNAECAEPLAELVDAGCSVEWYDHHQWDDAAIEAVEGAGVDLTIDTDECAASLIFREYGYTDYDDYIRDLVDVTKDRDLWINDDPRSERLSVYSRIANVEQYIDTVLEHGADLPDEIQRMVDERLELDIRLEDRAVREVDEHTVAGYRVGTTYTAGGNTSNIGNELVEHHDPQFDIAVIGTPTSVSFYAHSDDGTFDYCHQVAGKLGGGGHPTAAGADVPVENFRELAEWWSVAGGYSDAETRIFNAIASVVIETEVADAE